MGRPGLVVTIKMTLFWVILFTTVLSSTGAFGLADDAEWDAEEPMTGEDFIRFWLESPQIFEDDSFQSSYGELNGEFPVDSGENVDSASIVKALRKEDLRDGNAAAAESDDGLTLSSQVRFLPIEEARDKKQRQRGTRALNDRRLNGIISHNRIPSKYILLVDVGEDIDDLNQQQKEELIDSLASVLRLAQAHIHISWKDSHDSLLAFYFESDLSRDSSSANLLDLIPASEVEHQIAVQSLSSQLVSVRVYDVFPQDRLTRNIMVESIWTQPFFPYMVAIIAVFVICLIAIMIWCCLRNRHKKSESLLHRPSKTTPGVTQQISVLYPAAKPSMASATGIQPDVTQILTNRSPGFGTLPPSSLGGVYGSSRGLTSPFSGSGSGAGTPGYSSGSQSGTPVLGTPILGTPVHTPPLRLKKGLLERRGSNASLTLELGPGIASEQSSVGSPPRESTAEEYLQSASRRMSIKQLRQRLKDPKSIYEEFWEIPMNHADKIEVAGSGMKNRYRTIIPNEHSRVKLAERKGDPLSGYINANYIRGYSNEPNVYIATQGPMSNTVNDFWRMVWQEKAPIIIMITKLREKSRTKCENYLPERFGTYDDLDVHVNSISEREGYILRQLTIKYLNEEHKLLHYWYMAWPDHKAPSTARQLLHLVLEVEREHEQGGPKNKGPIVVHCSAGIGRTGCFIATSIGLKQVRKESEVDILSTVSQMRLDRGGMVQTNEQYEFVHQALSLYQEDLDEDTETSDES